MEGFGCITWWVLGVIWSPPIAFGIGVIMGIVATFMYLRPFALLVSLGCLVLCFLTGWVAWILTVKISEHNGIG
jgi:hypothetical protein